MRPRSPGNIASTLLAMCGLLAQSTVVTAHVVFQAPRVYANPAFRHDLDLSPQRATYIALGAKSYGESSRRALAMQQHIQALLDDPGVESLSAARSAWLFAREAYVETEVFRFNDGPIDAPASAKRAEGPESRINAWPVDESTIDYVLKYPKSGLVNELATPLTIASILTRDQASDESAVTTGWHAVEFLLWGQDRRRDGPGDRSFKDYLPGNASNDRRRAYLALVTAQLVADLNDVSSQWQSGTADNYHAQLLDTAGIEVVGRALHGATSLVVIELFGERLSVALDSASQEDEHSCFSDSSHLDLQHGVRGVAQLMRGEYAGARIGPSLLDVLSFKDPALAARVNRALNEAISHADALRPPFDQLILLPPEDPARRQAEATVISLHQLALAMKAAAEALGVQIVVPGV